MSLSQRFTTLVPPEVLFDRIAEGVFHLDREWRYTYLNRQAAELTGRSREQLHGCRVWDAHPWATNTAFHGEAHRAMADGRPRDFEIYRESLGAWFQTDLYPNPDGLLVVFRDITARRGREESLRESDERFRALTDQANELLMRHTPDGIIVYCSPASTGLLGYTPDEMTGRFAFDMVHPDDHARVVEGHARGLAREDRTPVEFRVRHRDGQELWFESTVSFLREAGTGALREFYTVSRDITARKQIEHALRESEAFARDIFESSPDCVKVLDRDARLHAMNGPGMCVMEIDDFSLFKGKEWITFWQPEDQPEVQAAIDAALAGSTGQFQALASTAKGTLKWWDVLVAPIRDADGQVERLVSISRDVTERMQAEQEREALLIREREANIAMQEAVQIRDALLANVSHDLQNPLAGIKGYAQISGRQFRREGRGQGDRLVTQMASIDAIATRMSRMLSELVDVAQMQAGASMRLDLQATDLVTIARETVAEHQRSAGGHAIELDVRDDELVGVWDSDRLVRVISNLISNAVKYSPDAGTVAVTVECTGGDVHDWARLTIRDHGIGIPPAELTGIFERFSRGSNVTGRIKGAGIGLASVKQIVEQHGGTIAIASVEGQGTTVTMRLPLA